MAPKDSNLPLDPDVKVPAAVKRAAAKAESYYPAESLRPTNPAPVQVEPVASVQVQPAINSEPVPAQVQPPQPAPLAPQPAPAAPVEPVQPAAPAEPSNFEHMYNSMKGRYDASQRTIGAMQEQMGQLGDELMRTQSLMQRGSVNPMSTLPPDIKPAYVTPEDVKNFGPDLIDLAKRAGLEAVAPQLTALERENQQLRQQVTQTRTQDIYEKLDLGLSTWREINTNPRWLQWLRLRDFNSAPLRQEQLNRAMQAADAPRVLDFFNRFLSEEVATGQMPAPQPPQPPAPEPRPAAISLTTLAAPGRPNPATGNTQVPDPKPVYTHDDIKTFYRYVQQGVYAGQEALKQQIEADIFAAQREGRVR